MVKRIAIQHPYTGLAESQSSARIIAAAERLGIDAKELRDSHDIIAYNPDFVLSISHQDPKLTPFPTYGVLTAPSEWYEKPRFMRNILTYDGYLTVTPIVKQWIEDITFGARKLNAPIGFYANTVLPYSGALERNNFRNPSLLYIGTNWDGSRHNELFNHLRKYEFLKLYGPDNSWHSFPDRYAGHLPFDDTSVLEAYRSSGVALCIEHPDFTRESMPSSRIYESLASGALAICARTDFNQHWFGDNVLYIDMDLPPGAIARQIVAHIDWIQTNPCAAEKKADTAHKIFCKHFALDRMLLDTINLHTETLASKGYSKEPPAKYERQKVGVIIRAGSRGPDFLRRSIGSVARQAYKNLTVFLILWQDPPGLDNVLSEYPNLNWIKIKVPGGARSDCQWAGLQAAKDDGCDLIGILDDDDEYHPNMVKALVDTYNYHNQLSFTKAVSMISGGSLVAHQKPQMNYTKFETENALPRPETRHIQHFHFGSDGQVNDRSYNSSPCSTFFVAKFLDVEVLQNPNLDIIDDWIIWLQLAERGRLVFVPEVVATVHEHDVDRAGYKGKTEGTFRNHVRIARRMFGRRFNSIEHYKAPFWLKHEHSDNLMATVISYPEPSERPGAVREYYLPQSVISESTKLQLPAGYSELVCFFEQPDWIEKTNIEIRTKLREYSATLKVADKQHPNGYVTGQLKFVITMAEESEPIHIKVSLPDEDTTSNYVDSLIRQKLEINSPAKIKFDILTNYKKIWLYGTSTLGEMTLNILDTHSIKPHGVADTFQSGLWHGFDILTADQLKDALSDNDAILISSEFWWEISNDLRERGINNHIFTIRDQTALATVFDT